MSRDIQLKQQLIDRSKVGPESSSGTVSATIESLSKLFEADNVKDGHSLQWLKKADGYAGIEKLLRTDLKKGITAEVSDRNWRSEKYGTNAPIVKTPKTLWEMILQNFEDKTIQILCFAAIVSLTLGIATHGIKQGWLQGASIILAVVIVAGVASFNNYMKEKQFRKLNEVAQRKNVNVTRNGQIVNMSVYELLVGDIVQVETGQIVSVDGLVFNTSNLSTDESSVTGETHQVTKSDYQPDKNVNPFLISGSRIMEGTSMMIVLAIGEHSQEGISKVKLQQETEDTPLQQKLSILADQIGWIGIGSAALTFTALLIHFLINVYNGKICGWCAESANLLVGYFIIAVSIVVMAVPEGLPLAVTISLAYSVGKMKDQNNLVRYLAACETMGGANNICSDKTGTLTKNQMTVVKLWSEYHNHDKFIKTRMLHKLNTDMLCIGVCLNSNANPKVETSGKFEQIGNKTQCALLEMAFNMGYDFRQFRKQLKVHRVIPFSSERKKMSCIAQMENGKLVLFTKGAPDFLLQNCTLYATETGQNKPIDQDFRQVLAHTISTFASQSLRTILICYREIKREQINSPDTDIENGLTILGLTGIKDPLKESIPESVNQCKRAGITVRMVTGDNTETATAIAKDANIIPGHYERPAKGQPGYYVVMEGKEFRQTVQGLVNGQGENKDKEYVKNIEAFRKIVKELRVLARSSPTDKYLLATGLRQIDAVVAMTGDGTNDAPALKKADIGFAMGIAGTQVAKEAAGIILLDDNFSSIITAVKYGRNIFDCIRKFLQFQLTVNVVAIFMAFLGSVVLQQSPLTPVQMLWVNLIMDTLAALALATQPPSDQLLLRMPYSRKEEIITPQMWRNIFMHSVFQMIVLSIVLFLGEDIFGVESSIGQEWDNQTGQHLSIFFNVFVFLQVFNFFNARKLKRQQLNVFADMGNNYLFILIVIGIFASQIFIVQFGGKALKLVPLSMGQHLVCILIGALSLVNGVFVKACIPDSLFNHVHLFHQDRRMHVNRDVDGYLKRILKQPATERRSSKRRH